jgi:hypothetical protein
LKAGDRRRGVGYPSSERVRRSLRRRVSEPQASFGVTLERYTTLALQRMAADHDSEAVQPRTSAGTCDGIREHSKKTGENVRAPHGGACVCEPGATNGGYKRGQAQRARVCDRCPVSALRGEAVGLFKARTRTPFLPTTCPQASISRVTFVTIV